MNKSDSLGNLAKALSIVQGKLRPAVKDSANPFFKSRYADLNSVWDSCRALLTENGLAVAQINLPAENGVIVETVLMHESGEWISGEIFLPLAKHDPQGVGSAITYGRRYGLAAIVGIVADEDDDGNQASQPKAKAQVAAAGGNQAQPIAARIGKAKAALSSLGVKVEPRADGESDEDYLASLSDQYKKVKAIADGQK